jgi:hypothetical protein
VAELKDNWQTTPQDSEIPVSSITSRATAFTTSSSYNLFQLEVKLYRENSPGTVTVELYLADGSDFPTGSVLSSGTLDGDSLTTSSTGVWYSPTMSTYTMLNATRYCIVLTPANAQPNSIHWKRSTFSGASGYTISSYDGSWGNASSNTSFGFKLWAGTGKATVPSPADSATGQRNNLPQLSWTQGPGANTENVYFGPTGNMSLVDTLNVTQTFDLSGSLPLDYNSTYQWRIDSLDDTGTTTGDTWSFTTLTFAPPSLANWPIIKRLCACSNNKFWYEDI